MNAAVGSFEPSAMPWGSRRVSVARQHQHFNLLGLGIAFVSSSCLWLAIIEAVI